MNTSSTEPHDTAAPVSIEQLAETFEAIRAEVCRVVIGQDEVVDQLLVALLARGHVLLESVPGLGKTLLARALSHVAGCSTRRIQFTPDLMPSDVVGGNVFDAATQRFHFIAGPVFTELLLADEINRAPAKTQSSLLEAMQERHVTVDGVSRALPQVFMTIATQNPVESQGTYPLPEAQLDRFLFKLVVPHPARSAELDILRAHLQGFDAGSLESAGLRTVTSAARLAAMQAAVAQVSVSPGLLDYLLTVMERTRDHRSVELGASPRASVALLSAARAAAAIDGRAYVVPDDVKGCAPAVLRHRLILGADAEFEGVSVDDIIAGILEQVAVPRSVA